MKSILTLLITVAVAGFVQAQTVAPAAPAEPVAPKAPTEVVAPAAPAEPAPKKVAAEVVPAKRVATPAKDIDTRDQKPTDLNELKKAQDQQRVQETIKQRQQITGIPAQSAPEKKEATPAATPKE